MNSLWAINAILISMRISLSIIDLIELQWFDLIELSKQMGYQSVLHGTIEVLIAIKILLSIEIVGSICSLLFDHRHSQDVQLQQKKHFYFWNFICICCWHYKDENFFKMIFKRALNVVWTSPFRTINGWKPSADKVKCFSIIHCLTKNFSELTKYLRYCIHCCNILIDVILFD